MVRAGPVVIAVGRRAGRRTDPSVVIAVFIVARDAMRSSFMMGGPSIDMWPIDILVGMMVAAFCRCARAVCRISTWRSRPLLCTLRLGPFLFLFDWAGTLRWVDEMWWNCRLGVADDLRGFRTGELRDVPKALTLSRSLLPSPYGSTDGGRPGGDSPMTKEFGPI